MIRRVAFIVLLLALGQRAFAQDPASRRAALAAQYTDGLIILPANWEEKAMEQPAWIQNPAFQYFTGLHEAPGLLLLIDGSTGESLLFAPPTPTSFGIPIAELDIWNRDDWVELSGVSAVLPVTAFKSYVSGRLQSGVQKIYLDEPRRAPVDAAPDDMLKVSGFHALWKQSLVAAFSDAEFGSIADAIAKMRWIKDEMEIHHLKNNGLFSTRALKQGMSAVRPGAMQRHAEAAVVASCLESGAEGPSFWPWVMTGPNAHIVNVVRSFYDYEHLNRAFEPGQLVRVDIGCMSGGFGGDVGRTVPVSGAFNERQAMIWDLLVIGYRAGMQIMKDGISLAQIEEASRNAVLKAADIDSDLAPYIPLLVAEDGVSWHLHGVGIESGEHPQPVLAAGAVIAFEPMFSDGIDAYYLEDMILITQDGFEVLTPGLPYTSEEIASFLNESR